MGRRRLGAGGRSCRACPNCDGCDDANRKRRNRGHAAQRQSSSCLREHSPHAASIPRPTRGLLESDFGERQLTSVISAPPACQRQELNPRLPQLGDRGSGGLGIEAAALDDCRYRLGKQPERPHGGAPVVFEAYVNGVSIRKGRSTQRSAWIGRITTTACRRCAGGSELGASAEAQDGRRRSPGFRSSSRRGAGHPRWRSQ